MKLAQIDHIALTCRSVEETAEWYRRVLGFKRIFADQWNGVPVFLKLGSTAVALFPLNGKDASTECAGPGVDHFALLAETRRDFAEAREALRGLGINHNFSDHGVSHSVYFRDPDGHRLEITTYDI